VQQTIILFLAGLFSTPRPKLSPTRLTNKPREPHRRGLASAIRRLRYPGLPILFGRTTFCYVVCVPIRVLLLCLRDFFDRGAVSHSPSGHQMVSSARTRRCGSEAPIRDRGG